MSTALLWQTLRRTWWWIVLGGVLGALVASLGLRVLPETYESRAAILIEAAPAADGGEGTAQLQEYVEARLPTLIQIAGADDVVSAIAQQEGSSPEDVESRLAYEVPTDTTVLQVTAEGDSPEASQQTATGAAEVLSQRISTTSTADIAMTATVLDSPRPGEAVAPKPSIAYPSGVLAGALLGLLAALVAGSRRQERRRRTAPREPTAAADRLDTP